MATQSSSDSYKTELDFQTLKNAVITYIQKTGLKGVNYYLSILTTRDECFIISAENMEDLLTFFFKDKIKLTKDEFLIVKKYITEKIFDKSNRFVDGILISVLESS